MIRNGLKLGILTALALFMAACSSEEQVSKSMEQIQKEEGLPVTVQTVKTKPFEKVLTYYGKFKGYKETTVGAMIGGRVEKILAKPGTAVKKDQVIIEFPEDAPASQYQQAKTAYENSKRTYERMKALHDRGEISQANFEGVEAKYKVDKRNYETMKDMLKLDAPYDGVVTEVFVHEGDNVKGKAALFTVAQLNKMKIRIWLSDDERMQVKRGMTAEATVGGKTFAGEVDEISLSVDPRNQAFYADILFDNPNREILPGLTAAVKVVLYRNPQAVVVARNVLRFKNNKPFVFLAENNTAKKQALTLGLSTGMQYEVASGLKPGDSLIVEGLARLEDGAKIKIVE